jgi:hypothetical protein
MEERNKEYQIRIEEFEGKIKNMDEGHKQIKIGFDL